MKKIVSLLTVFAFSTTAFAQMADLVIKNANLFDGTGAETVKNASIAIKDGKILSINKGNKTVKAKKTIDAAGKTVMPGLINSHLHLFFDFYNMPPKMPATSDASAEKFINGDLSKTLRGHLEQGITSILSPIDFGPQIYEVREKVAKGIISGPRVFVAGPVLINSGDYYACGGLTGAELDWCNKHVRLPIDTPELARESVKQLVKSKSDVVVVDGLTNQKVLNKANLVAIVDEAHKNNLKVLIHNSDAKYVKDIVDAGVDGFIHPPGITKDTEGSLVKPIGEHKLPIAITLGFLQRYIGLGYAEEKDKNDYTILENNIQVALKAGAIPLFTSDMPGIPPTEVIPTVIKVMKGEGIDNKTILLSATKEGAKAIGAKNLGTLEKGKIADLIVIDGDPLVDINALLKVETVVKDGKIVADKKKYAHP
ncbi:MULTISPECIES: amidohydrolase family protein [unclassified Chryseobacterium]|uniref:amidohydrolase family protein n=1 Tax=unclassified Chryseobacterium TaxID=2593645 RepID=UPI0009156E5F|nr:MULTISPECIES: amidohydrolase family protein [unclassified Chryseobacterium]SHF79946.1 Imidazolonepropionase [Chryseobacterium sp. OV279]HCA09431.1 hypothetical protein [Chryseobacterium sp.]